MGKSIRFVKIEDAERIAAIYNHYVLHTDVSFEECAVSEEEMRKRIEEKTRAYPWIVYEEDGKVLGYAYVGKWKERSAYRHTAEDTIYVEEGERGRGIGGELFESLMAEAEKDKEIHAIIGVIALPNVESVALHEKHGFKKVAHFKEAGYKNGKWIDVGNWEKVMGTGDETP